jgi:hypothetical protein
MEVFTMKRAMLTLAMLAAVGGCDAANVFAAGVVGGTGSTIGTAIAEVVLGFFGVTV